MEDKSSFVVIVRLFPVESIPHGVPMHDREPFNRFRLAESENAPARRVLRQVGEPGDRLVRRDGRSLLRAYRSSWSSIPAASISCSAQALIPASGHSRQRPILIDGSAP